MTSLLAGMLKNPWLQKVSSRSRVPMSTIYSKYMLREPIFYPRSKEIKFVQGCDIQCACSVQERNASPTVNKHYSKFRFLSGTEIEWMVLIEVSELSFYEYFSSIINYSLLQMSAFFPIPFQGPRTSLSLVNN